jgi:chaperonin GroES
MLEDGTRSELQVKAGDQVIFSSYAGETFTVNDQELLLMREDDILAVIED